MHDSNYVSVCTICMTESMSGTICMTETMSEFVQYTLACFLFYQNALTMLMTEPFLYWHNTRTMEQQY